MVPREPGDEDEGEDEIPRDISLCPDPSLFKDFPYTTRLTHESPSLVRIRRNTRLAWTVAVLAIAATVFLVLSRG